MEVDSTGFSQEKPNCLQTVVTEAAGVVQCGLWAFSGVILLGD